MGVGVRCFQCKQKVKGWGTGREHANATGHTWQPGYYCTDCEQTFASHKLCKKHIKEAGIHSKASPANTDRPPLAPSRLVTAPLALSVQVPRPDVSLLTTSGLGAQTRDGPSPLQCTICRPPAAFSSKEALEQHLSETSTCTKCAIHFFEAEELQEHYRTTSAHPKCRECGDGFPGISEWATHRARCPPPLPPPLPGAAAASSAQNASAPRSISDGFSSAGGQDGVSRYDTGVDSEPASEVFSVAPGSPPLHPAEVARPHNASDSVSDETSVARDALETPMTENENEDWDSRSSSFRDSMAPLRVDKGKGKAFSSNGAATPITVASTTTTTLEGSQKPEARAAKRLSFHCRSCLADPCVKPVVTLCGHIFCHSCIVRELATRMGCPLCQRPFFVRLDVGVGS